MAYSSLRLGILVVLVTRERTINRVVDFKQADNVSVIEHWSRSDALSVEKDKKNDRLDQSLYLDLTIK